MDAGLFRRNSYPHHPQRAEFSRDFSPRWLPGAKYEARRRSALDALAIKSCVGGETFGERVMS